MVYDFFEELKDIIVDRIKDFYKKSKYFLLVLVFLVLILCIFFLERVDPNTVETQQLIFFGISIENWREWITIITIPYTAGWAIYQYIKNLKAKKQKKAVEIGKEFSKELVDKCGIIYMVYSSSSLNDLLKFDEKNYDEFKFFNVDELRKIYKNDDFPTIYSKTRDSSIQELDMIYHEILRVNISPYNVDEKNIKLDVDVENKHIKAVIEKNKTINNKNIFILQNKNMPYHFMDLVSDVLNQLEYICMDISSKATDSSFIYQSLHQMFLRTVRTLAADISVDNCNFSDKYYINIIHVYNEWTTTYIKDLKKERRKKEKINRKLNPKIKTV